ncbi:precorrin-6y C5,15-methyltransferase (decarboxylating) subunit CbiE [Bremerella cremea]|uniref:Precorrin-6y C5,15-methyltransferase (Decarboxylating) subunit CbiE n=1 Tax=Bremerella cremea TaxID=1031537 RepID=A0A368KYM2_9BACT|nr:precorrin-6y C5,15-methyltransferase (decarboxylating) subunit CbiE [Bremerella cremea]
MEKSVSTSPKIFIVGIGDDGFEGLTSQSTRILGDAQVIVGNPQVLGHVEKLSAEKVPVGGDLGEIVETLEKHQAKNVVLLTSGDPLFYGVSKYLCDKLGKDRFQVIPHVSSMQLAFARIKESWDDAHLANLANQPLESVIAAARISEAIGLFTTEEIPPKEVAKTLLGHDLDYFHAYVCENLGSPNECVTQGELKEIAEQSFGPLNVMILVRKPDVPDRPMSLVGKRKFGNPDDVFRQSKPKRGLLTPMEVRCIALSLLDLGDSSVVWDVGAGSGSVSIEAGMIAEKGAVYAIEMDPEDHGLIRTNIENFAVKNVQAVLGKAPEAWATLPDPDCIFIGGTGRQIRGICEQALQRLKPGGRIVANISSIENLADVHQLFDTVMESAKVTMVNISHATYQLERHRFEASNPTFLVSGKKPLKKS